MRAMTTHAIDAKRKFLRIGTHSGTFHCDEALGCFLLQQLSPERCHIFTSPPPGFLGAAPPTAFLRRPQSSPRRHCG